MDLYCVRTNGCVFYVYATDEQLRRVAAHYRKQWHIYKCHSSPFFEWHRVVTYPNTNLLVVALHNTYGFRNAKDS